MPAEPARTCCPSGHADLVEAVRLWYGDYRLPGNGRVVSACPLEEGVVLIDCEFEPVALVTLLPAGDFVVELYGEDDATTHRRLATLGHVLDALKTHLETL